MSHADMNNCCGFNEAAAAFSWNSPKKAINPYLDPAEVAPVSALSNLIALYAADNEQEHLRREALSDQVWERYFFNESRDPVQREMEQDKLISRAKLAHEQQRFNPDTWWVRMKTCWYSNRTYANRSNAERAAKMQWERLQRGVASFSLQLAEGRADLYTEMPVKVSGFKQPIDDAEWTITTLTHTVSPDNGFTTSLELEVKVDDLEME